MAGECTPHPPPLCDPGVLVVSWGSRRSTRTIQTSAAVQSSYEDAYLCLRNLSCQMSSGARTPALLTSRLLQLAVSTRMIVSACSIVADTGPGPSLDFNSVQRISRANNFRGMAVQLFKLLGMAAGQEEGLVREAIKAAGQLCGCASPRRAECLEGMSAIAAGGNHAKGVVADACGAAARLQGTAVETAEGALDLVLTLVEAAAQQGRRAPNNLVVYVTGRNSWLPTSSWQLGAAREVVLMARAQVIAMDTQHHADLHRKLVAAALTGYACPGDVLP